MGKRYPKFHYKRAGNQVVWHGTLRPSSSSPEYLIKIEYSFPFTPKVSVEQPTLIPNFPHRYGDNTLCLFYPKDFSWHKRKYIADTIVPWTIEWLTLYELWLITNIWAGPEVHHTGAKI